MSLLPGYSLDTILYKCIKCNKSLPISEYNQMKYESGNTNSEVKQTCKSCNKKAKKILDRLKKQHPAPSPTEKCPCCNKSLIELRSHGQKVFNSWRLHHDHKTEKFLGYVCHICNTGMGNFKDNPENMRRAADWLESKLCMN